MSATTAAAELAALEQLLVEERAAVGALDGAALARIAEAKAERLLHLSAALVETDGADEDALATRLEALRAQAEVNRALIADAIDAVVVARGLGGGPKTYDRRARAVGGGGGLVTRSL